MTQSITSNSPLYLADRGTARPGVISQHQVVGFLFARTFAWWAHHGSDSPVGAITTLPVAWPHWPQFIPMASDILPLLAVSRFNTCPVDKQTVVSNRSEQVHATDTNVYCRNPIWSVHKQSTYACRDIPCVPEDHFIIVGRIMLAVH